MLRIFLCRVRLKKTVGILLASADPSPADVLGHSLSRLFDHELRAVDRNLSPSSEHCVPRAFA